MKTTPERVYILTDNGYEAISYQDFCNVRKANSQYMASHWFITIQGMLIGGHRSRLPRFLQIMGTSALFEKVGSKRAIAFYSLKRQNAVVRRRQWGRLRENHARVRFPWRWRAGQPFDDFP